MSNKVSDGYFFVIHIPLWLIVLVAIIFIGVLIYLIKRKRMV